MLRRTGTQTFGSRFITLIRSSTLAETQTRLTITKWVRQGSMSIMTKDIKIEVTSDSICPFCYIGKRKLDKAIATTKEKGLDVKFDVEFKPFLLDPSLKEDIPVVKRERYEAKFGGKARMAAMEQAMIGRGKEVGINFSYGGLLRQTTSSHRLLALAYEKGGQEVQAQLLEMLFNGYFEHEQDIGGYDFLIPQAVAVGLFEDAAEAKEWLDGDEKRAEVAKGIYEAQMLGITGVPFFVVNYHGRKYAISGAEDSQLFEDIFEKLVKDGNVNGMKGEGDTR